MGHPRLKLIGDQNAGIFNLRITDASLTDDGEYECQVGRYLRIKPIRASAHLIVTCESKYDDVRRESLARPVQLKEEAERGSLLLFAITHVAVIPLNDWIRT